MLGQALPGLWAAIVSLAVLSGTILYQRPPAPHAPQTTVEQQTGPVVVTIFGADGLLGHIASELVYTVRKDDPQTAPVEALISDQLARAMSGQPVEFVNILNNEDALKAFLTEHLADLPGYKIVKVEAAAFHPPEQSEDKGA